jgi:DNA-binding transcriptional MerR regulator
LKTTQKLQGGRHAGRDTFRPVDLAREHGISPQAVRNYERDGMLPAAERTPSGYRRYTALHAAALRAYLALVAGYGYAAGGEIMLAVNRGDLDTALRAIDTGHTQLLRDRETLDAVSAAIGVLAGPRPATHPSSPAQASPTDSPEGVDSVGSPGGVDSPGRSVPIAVLAHRLNVTPATLRKWERAGILTPPRDHVTGHRRYRSGDVRDAELAHLLRRGGYRLVDIAGVVAQVRATAGPEALAGSLAAWRQRLAARGRSMLTAAARLAEYLPLLPDPPARP